MKRVVVDHFGGPEVLEVVEEDDPRPGPGEVRVRVLAAGVSFTDAQLRAGTYLGGPKPPFTPGYELVGVVEELGPGCSRLRVGDRIGALTVWGADAERVCVPEEYAVEVPEDLDPAEVVSLIFPYMTAYQMLHRTARVKSGETVLVHGAAGRVGTAALELGAVAGLRLYRDRFGSRPRRGRAARRGGDRLPQRGLPGAGARADRRQGVDVVLDGIGGTVSLRSFRALRRRYGRLGGVFGAPTTRWCTGARTGRRWIEWYAATAIVWLWGTLSPRRRVLAATGVQTAAHPATRTGSGRTSACCSSCSVRARSTRSWPSACRCPRLVALTRCSRARRRRESSCSCHRPTRTLADGARRPCWSSRAGRVR